jgi:Flp pilus assembly protein TadG
MLRTLANHAKLWARDESGIAAVEMAFIAPVALGFLSLVVASGQALTIYHRTVLTAHSVTDIVSRTPYQADPNISSAETLSSTGLDADLALGQLVFYPTDATNLKVVMTELVVNPSTNQGTVKWSEGYNGGVALSCGTVINLDPSYSASGASYLLYGQVNYAYQPLGVLMNLAAMTLTATEILTIRNAPQITVSGVQTQC